MRILFTIPSLHSGGAERVVVRLAGEFVRRGHQVGILTLQSSGRDFYSVPKGVERFIRPVWGQTNIFSAATSAVRRIAAIATQIRESEPEVVLSFLARMNVFAIPAAKSVGIPVIVSERNNPARSKDSKLIRGMRRYYYPKADRLIAISEGVASMFSWMPADRRVAILNPVEPFSPCTGALSQSDPKRHRIIAVGRLVPQKGFDLLIDAFSRLAEAFPDWDLFIFGDGYLRPELERLREERNLGNRIMLPGTSHCIQDEMRASEFFVFSSRYEGLGNVLLETMQVGTPPVSFDCDFGPREIVDDGDTGILVPDGDVAALAEAMRRLMEDAALRRRLGYSARAKVERDHSLSAIAEQWESVVRSVIK